MCKEKNKVPNTYYKMEWSGEREEVIYEAFRFYFTHQRYNNAHYNADEENRWTALGSHSLK